MLDERKVEDLDCYIDDFGWTGKSGDAKAYWNVLLHKLFFVLRSELMPPQLNQYMRRAPRGLLASPAAIYLMPSSLTKNLKIMVYALRVATALPLLQCTTRLSPPGSV